MLTSFRQKAKIYIPVLRRADSARSRGISKETFGDLKEAVGRYCGKRQDAMTPLGGFGGHEHERTTTAR